LKCKTPGCRGTITNAHFLYVAVKLAGKSKRKLAGSLNAIMADGCCGNSTSSPPAGASNKA